MFGLRGRHGSEEHRFDDAENRRVRSDPNAQRHGHRQREARCTPHRADRRPEVPDESVDQSRAPRLTRGRPVSLDPAEGDHRRAAGLLPAHSGGNEPLGLLVDVEADLLVHRPVELVATKEVARPPKDATDRAHHGQLVPRISSTALTYRCQLSVSLPKARRPIDVMS